MGFVFNYVKMNCEMSAAHFKKKRRNKSHSDRRRNHLNICAIQLPINRNLFNVSHS